MIGSQYMYIFVHITRYFVLLRNALINFELPWFIPLKQIVNCGNLSTHISLKLIGSQDNHAYCILWGNHDAIIVFCCKRTGDLVMVGVCLLDLANAKPLNYLMGSFDIWYGELTWIEWLHTTLDAACLL